MENFYFMYPIIFLKFSTINIFCNKNNVFKRLYLNTSARTHTKRGHIGSECCLFFWGPCLGQEIAGDGRPVEDGDLQGF